MSNKTLFIQSSLIIFAGCFLIFFGCASQKNLQSFSPLLKKSETVLTVNSYRTATRDTLISADSFVDKYSGGIQGVPECSEINFLIKSAENACRSDSFNESHILLRKALSSIKEKEETDKEWPDAENYYNDVARIYTEKMPTEYTDSIPDEISMLVFQKQLSQSLDTLKLSSNDSIMLKKLTCQKGVSYNFPIIWNDRVYRSLYFLSKGGKGPVDKWLLRSSHYLPFMRRMFADSGLPTDLAYLPLIESGFNPLAYSRRHASGIWQFIASTGTNYGLRKNYWLDERRDPLKSTQAAISYLKKLYNQFGDWQLAIAAYNCGESGVVKAINRTSDANYWHLLLPNETINYVPEFISALIVAKNPECFGFTSLSADSFYFDTVSIDECINLQAVADSLGISSIDLHSINPHILHWCTPPSVKQPQTRTRLYLPKGSKERFLQSYAQSPASFRVSWFTYQVKPGENLFGISRQFKVPLEAVKSINNLGASCHLSVNRRISIPIPLHMTTAQAYVIAEDLARGEYPSLPKAVKNGQIRYMVRSGETVWDLARLFKISAGDICTWNNIADDQNLQVGQILILYTKQSFPKTNPSPRIPALSIPVRDGLAKYQVLPGDNLYSIARKLGISVPDLIAINGLDDNKPVIYAGQSLAYCHGRRQSSNIPQPDTVFYRVCRGDNLYSLAATFSVSIGDLMLANNLTASSKLRVGDLLRIPFIKRTSSGSGRQGHAATALREERL